MYTGNGQHGDQIESLNEGACPCTVEVEGAHIVCVKEYQQVMPIPHTRSLPLRLFG